MAKGGRGQCQKVGRTAGTGMLDGRVGRVAMSVAGGQCTVCRGGLHKRPVLRQSGCSAWAMSRGVGVSAREIGCGKGGSTQSSGACRETDLCVGEAMETFVGGADVAGLDGEVRGGKKRTMLPNCPELISLVIAVAKLSCNLSLASA